MDSTSTGYIFRFVQLHSAKYIGGQNIMWPWVFKNVWLWNFWDLFVVNLKTIINRLFYWIYISAIKMIKKKLGTMFKIKTNIDICFYFIAFNSNIQPKNIFLFLFFLQTYCDHYRTLYGIINTWGIYMKIFYISVGRKIYLYCNSLAVNIKSRCVSIKYSIKIYCLRSEIKGMVSLHGLD